MKKCLTILSSLLLLLLPANLANGCGFILDEEEYRVCLLQPDVSGHSELMALCYSPDYFYGEGINNNAAMMEANAREWQQHTHYKGSWKEIQVLMYDIGPDLFLARADSLARVYPFLNYLQKHYSHELDYLCYARRCELMINSDDPWRLNEGIDTTLAARCLQEGEALYKAATNDFLKLRISYQLLKLSYYHPGFGEEVAEVYNTRIKPLRLDSWLKESAHFYALSAESHSAVDYQYLLTRSFDLTIDKRFRCVQLFDRKNIRQVLPLAKSDHEKAVMWLMYELQNPGRSLPDIHKIYSLDQGNKDLAFLMSREVNKLEDWLLTPELTEQDPAILENMWDEETREVMMKKQGSLDAYLKALYAFANKVIAEGKQAEPALWQVLASHICILQKNMEDAKKHLQLAEQMPGSNKVQFQVKLNQLIMSFDSKTRLTPALEQQVLAFEAYNKAHPDVFLKQNELMNQAWLFIGKRLVHAGDVAQGIFFLSKTNRVLGTISYWTTKDYYEELLEHARPADYDRMLAMMDKTDKSPFEHFLTERNVSRYLTYDSYFYGYDTRPDTIQVNRSKVLDYKSMYYVQHNQLDSALQCVNQIPASYWEQRPYQLFKCFPFMVPGGLELQSNNDFCPYNKRQYLQRMCDLQTLIATNTGDVARHHFVLATGYFNMGYHGNYWIMNMPYKLSDEVSNNFYELDTKNKPFIENYYGCKLAQDHYLEAMRLAKDTAFAALCAARASACNIHLQEIRWRETVVYNRKAYDWNKAFVPAYGAFKKAFEARFGNKDYYDDFVSNCYHYEHLGSRYY